MRATILARDFPPILSGIGDHTDHMAAELARRGCTVTVLCSTVVRSAPAEQRASFAVKPLIERMDARGYARVAAAVSDTAPDVIVWQYNPFNVGRHGIALGAGRLARSLAAIAPLVVFAHELWFPWGRAGFRGFLWAVAQRAQARGVLRAASHIIVTTPAREQKLSHRYGARVSRMPVGTNVAPVDARRRGDGGDPRAQLGIPGSAFLVAVLGGVGPGRDLAPAYEAIRLARASNIDVRLLLIGNTGPLQVPQGLSGAVHATGALPRENLSQWLETSDVYLHADPAGPSAGRRTTIVAAMAHGLAVVSYDGPDRAPELIDGQNVLLVPARPGPLADVLRELAGDRERARRLGAAAFQTYEEIFAWSRIGQALFGVLEGVRQR